MSKDARENLRDAKVFEMDFSQFQMSQEQKFLFDLKGYVVIPDVFNDDEVKAMKEQVYKIVHEPESLPPEERTVPGGASEIILSNKVVKGSLKELIGPDFRLDNQYAIWRKHGGNNIRPHNGGPMRSAHLNYHFTGGQIYSALTRVVVELNPVKRGDGGTVFLAGSHKANFDIPESLKEFREDNYESYFESYEASPGSIVIFSENTCHAGPVWKNPDQPRVSIFLCFSEIGTMFHRFHFVTPEVIAGLGPEARWYFRDNWPWDNTDRDGKYEGRNKILVRDDGSYVISP